MRVTLADDDTNAAAIKTSVQLLDNVVYAEDTASASADPGVMILAKRLDTPANSSATDGDYEPLQVSAGRLWTSGVVTGTVAVTQSGTWDEVGINDSGNSITVDWAGTAPPIGAGLEATALRVTVATDSTGVLSVDDNGGSLTIDNAQLSVVGSGTEAAAMRVTIATDSTGVLSVDDNGSSLTIDGLVTANPGTAANWGIYVEDAAETAGANLMMAGSVRRDTAASSAGTTGDNATVNTDATGGLWIAGSQAEDAAHTSADRGVMALGVRTDVPNAVGAGTTGDYSFLATDMAGGVRTALYETDFAVLGTKHVKKYYTNAGAVTDGIVWSPAAGARWYVTDIILNVSAAATVTFEDDKAGGDEAVMKFELAANSGLSHSFATPWFSGEDAADLLVTTSAGNVYITVTGYEI